MAEAAKVEKVVTTVTVNLTLTEEEAAYLGGLLIEGPNWDTAPWARDIHEALSAAGARHKALSLRYEGKEMYTNFDVSEVGRGFLMGFREAEVVTDLDADLPVQWGIYFKDTEVLQGGFEDLEDVEEHVKFLVSHGTIYSHEYKIVKIRYEIEEVV